MPTNSLEQSIVAVIMDWLSKPSDVLGALYPDDPNAERLADIIDNSDKLKDRFAIANNPIDTLTNAITKITLGDGELKAELDRHGVMQLLELATLTRSNDQTSTDQKSATILTSIFEHRKRGVESKIMTGTTAATKPDHVLVTNIAIARHWLTKIKAGTSIADIAAKEGCSIRQIQRHVE